MKPEQTCTNRDSCSHISGSCPEALACYERALAGEGVPTREVPGCLMRLGLIVPRDDAPGFSQAVPPAVGGWSALRPLEEQLSAIERQHARTKAALSLFEGVYSAFHARNPVHIGVLSGKAVIDKALDAAAQACRTELLTAQPGGGRPSEVLEEAVAREQAFAERGVRRRTLYQHTVRSHRPTLAYVERITASGAEVRTLPEIFERLIVIDRELAFIPMSEDRISAALEIRHPALVRYLVLMFDHAWDRAAPLEGSDGTATPQEAVEIVSDIQRSILGRVVAGETDEAIARRLGMSRRSVVEHVRKVSVQLGSNSRAQLGYLLATSGLLEDPA
ncbi:LuxR C-terminal-related transcriptional regulator [Streptacidiphilus jiangxiensis]|uniref:Regulatory protein, luxR family n=1 Tax=Streptacidiphilus jiangxiensis TaxID=235985 RepID=A0A1H7ZN09_STRJI|nr:LuxR C-terminal-related transcriptional regulator [Streptacidiphilus jiangxiensis]SEM59962.1 regulatory protein, luxR family [Streptacidiphilus jiangxiensis]